MASLSRRPCGWPMACRYRRFQTWTPSPSTQSCWPAASRSRRRYRLVTSGGGATSSAPAAVTGNGELKPIKTGCSIRAYPSSSYIFRKPWTIRPICNRWLFGQSGLSATDGFLTIRPICNRWLFGCFWGLWPDQPMLRLTVDLTADSNGCHDSIRTPVVADPIFVDADHW
jgi:hypothetical protein